MKFWPNSVLKRTASCAEQTTPSGRNSASAAQDALHVQPVTTSHQVAQGHFVHAGQHRYTNQQGRRCQTAEALHARLSSFSPHPMHALTIHTQLGSRGNACAVVFGISWNLRSRKTSKPRCCGSRTICGPNNVNISLPTLRRQSRINTVDKKPEQRHVYCQEQQQENQ